MEGSYLDTFSWPIWTLEVRADEHLLFETRVSKKFLYIFVCANTNIRDVMDTYINSINVLKNNVIGYR